MWRSCVTVVFFWLIAGDAYLAFKYDHKIIGAVVGSFLFIAFTGVIDWDCNRDS